MLHSYLYLISKLQQKFESIQKLWKFPRWWDDSTADVHSTLTRVERETLYRGGCITWIHVWVGITWYGVCYIQLCVSPDLVDPGVPVWGLCGVGVGRGGRWVLAGVVSAALPLCCRPPLPPGGWLPSPHTGWPPRAPSLCSSWTGCACCWTSWTPTPQQEHTIPQYIITCLLWWVKKRPLAPPHTRREYNRIE